ncbi:MAG: hypothetical protein A3D64_02325 [Candidatus Wildermuthbacteria bacterium RIFCSPHIGHO2_02_FULL_49_9]|uniref:histidine kinase n=2 Tax=Candidatus Wildermuthiibacteriota TaxID=1817923 RepID=A0A1G2QYL1_9BACT|nr:MAG: hypothetical protein A2672_01905 [Candidatus Wildermuthbacteria bacterium RIFCSPHIGHO2_01_FULL_49_22b]OHA70412.1 MAG: hypothetical protein A3D64_02325 [Candidatus Wildermuthbacteria bacterium RIFCSPHIGHO2_02_FULL_49_9]
MRISLRAFILGLLAFFVFMGGIFVYLATQVFYHNLLQSAPENTPEELLREATISIAIQQGFIILTMLLLVGGILFFVLTAFVLTPIRKLHAAFEKVGKGDFDIHLPEGPKNEIGDLFHAFNDMTARLKHVKEREVLVNRMKSDFLSLAAHQLRTPLSAIKWTLHMLIEGEMGKLTKKQGEFLSKTQTSNERLIRIVNDLLDVTRIGEGQYLYKQKLVSLEDIVRRAVESYQEEARRKKLKIVLVKPPDSLPPVFADEEKLQLAVQNLISNAVQYTRQGPAAAIEVKISQNANRDIEVAVQDTGIGIPDKQQARVFERFFRASNARRVDTEGSGLGLYLVKNIVEAHGGKVWFVSKEGKGSTFTFSLPCAKTFPGS